MCQFILVCWLEWKKNTAQVLINFDQSMQCRHMRLVHSIYSSGTGTVRSLLGVNIVHDLKRTSVNMIAAVCPLQYNSPIVRLQLEKKNCSKTQGPSLIEWDEIMIGSKWRDWFLLDFLTFDKTTDFDTNNPMLAYDHSPSTWTDIDVQLRFTVIHNIQTFTTSTNRGWHFL